MASWLNKRREIGWTAVVTMPDGLYGVSVLASQVANETGRKSSVAALLPAGN